MFVKREDAVMADRIIQSLIDKHQGKGDNTIYPNEILAVIPELSIEQLNSLRSIILTYQDLHRLRIFENYSGGPNGLDIGGFTEGFIHLGGFTRIWDEEEKERLAREKVNTVNESVLITNNTVRWMSIVSAGAALASLSVAILAYNNTSDINVKSLPQRPIQVQPIIISQKPIDTVYLLNPAPSQKRANYVSDTSKSKDPAIKPANR